MKRFMTTTAAAMLLATGAYAQDDNAFPQYQSDPETQLYASDLLGARIYATEGEVGETMQAGAEAEWDDLGEINDMVLSQDGQVEVVILGIGGFLGLGERDVAVQMDQLQIVRDGAQPTDYFLVVNAAQEEIENAPEYVRPEVEAAAPAAGTGAGMGTGTGTGMGAGTGMGTGATATDPAATAPADSGGMSGESTSESVGDAADATGNAAENAAEETASEAEDAANAAEGAAEDAAEAAGDAAESAGDAVENAGEEAEDATTTGN